MINALRCAFACAVIAVYSLLIEYSQCHPSFKRCEDLEFCRTAISLTSEFTISKACTLSEEGKVSALINNAATVNHNYVLDAIF